MASRSIKHRENIKKKQPFVGVLVFVTIFVGVLLAGFGGVWALCNSWLQDLPNYEDADAFNTAQPTTVYASDGKTVLAEFQLENREPVEMDQISEYVVKGTVATEDERFYEHGGVDFMGIARAVVNNLMGGELEGASTITQQFVRNTILSSEMDSISFKRKIREAYISIKVEEMYSKDEILLMYLNTINYGSGAYGIQAASQRYFSKDASDLTIAEAATLIGIPQSPTYNNPIDYPENCLERRNVVLSRMLSNGVITQEEYDAAKAEPIKLDTTEPSQDGILKYPYFTSYVRDLLTDPDGKYAYSRDEVFKGGLTVITTLDVDAQKAAEEAAERKADAANSYRGGEDVYECAMVAIDPDNGYVRALVGGRDYYENQVNLATGSGGSGRQAGSSFKTFTLLAALEAGINPQTTINAGTTVELADGTTVSNINHTDYGTKTIEGAFEVSSNTAFIRLIMSIGPEKVIDVAQRMGISAEMDPVASLTLGTASVTPLEMSAAYAVIANGGTYYEPEVIQTVTDRKGNVLVDNSNPEGERAISAEVAHAATEVMEGVITSGTGTAARLSNGQVAAGKTGTSDLYMDSWFCGITPQYSVAIWLGDRSDYVDAQPVPSSVSAASAFADFLDEVLKDAPLEDFPEADDPEYQASYKDPEYDIGGYYKSEEELKKEEEERKKKEEEERKKAEEEALKEQEQQQQPTTPGTGGETGGNTGGNTGGETGGGEEPPVPDPEPEPEPEPTPSARSLEE